MATRLSPILDYRGLPFQKANGKPRPQLAEAIQRTRRIAATYDAARVSDETKNYWANTDAFDSDSANSKAVREYLVHRSRYEISNNGYAAGIASTLTTDLIGKGPSLRMQTGSENFNRMIETVWFYWTKAIQWRRKLWCLAHATHSDGEGIGVIRRNPRINHTIKLDVRLYETEQCQTPFVPFGEPGYIDGIKFDEFGTPVWYDILQEHPGSSNWINMNLIPEQVPARFVLHWFKMRRPGQHRGIPESTSTLNVGAAARRWREATLAAAETAADFAVMLETQYEPDELDAAEPFSTLNIQKRMMTALPNSMKASQLKAEHPSATYEAFHNTLINEQARPTSMPRNRAACDSSGYNFASGRLDDIPYKSALDVYREDCNDLVLDPLFDVWFETAILTYGWLGGNPDAVSPAARAHIWDWPKHSVADTESEANANDKQLKNGCKSLAAIYSESGLDYEDECDKMATSNGITLEQQKQINLLLNLPQHVLPVVATQILGLVPEPEPEPSLIPEEEDEEEERQAAAANVNINIRAYGEDQPRDEAGRFGEGGGGSATKSKGGGKSGSSSKHPPQKQLSARAERAKASHNPSTKAKQDESEQAEVTVTQKLGGVKSNDNRPVDVTVDGKHGVELKVMHDAKEGRVNMRPDSRTRKEQWAKEEKGRTLHTVLIDNRGKFDGGKHADKYSGHKIYYKAGVGAYRLETMTKVKDYAELKQLIRGSK